MQMNLTPVTDALSKEYVYVDNELQDAIKKVSLFSILSRHKDTKKKWFFDSSGCFCNPCLAVAAGKINC